MELLAILTGCFGLGFMFSRRRRIGSWRLPTRDLLIGITLVVLSAGCLVGAQMEKGHDHIQDNRSGTNLH